MRHAVIVCAAGALCLVATAALGATAVVTEAAPVYNNAKEVIETLPAGAEVATGQANKNWILVKYRKDERTMVTGWVLQSKLDPIPQGFAGAGVSEHCVLHVQDAGSIERFDLTATEGFHSAIARGLVNAKDEPAFAPSTRLRIYLFNRKTFEDVRKQHGQPKDSIGFSPKLGQVFLDFSLRDTGPQQKALIVHELARLVLLDYSRQPPNRRGAGGPLQLWLIESFATYHEFHEGFNTEILLYVPKKPKLSDLRGRLPRKERDRDAYLATAGTVGHMLLNYGTAEQFSVLVRAIQANAGDKSPEVIMLEHYKLSRGKFQSEWARYVELLKKKYGIDKLEEQIEEEDEGLFNSPHAWGQDHIKRFLPPQLDALARRFLINKVLGKLPKQQ